MREYNFTWGKGESIDEVGHHGASVNGIINNKEFTTDTKFKNDFINGKVYSDVIKANIYGKELTDDDKEIILFMSLVYTYDATNKYGVYPHSIVRIELELLGNEKDMIANLINSDVKNGIATLVNYQPSIFGNKLHIYSATLFNDLNTLKNNLIKIKSHIIRKYQAQTKYNEIININFE